VKNGNRKEISNIEDNKDTDYNEIAHPRRNFEQVFDFLLANPN
jgi:hypothetical protein